MSASADTASGGTRYQFVEHLASGGMADLFVADALGVGGVRKRVAIKQVQPRHASDEQFVGMFLNEARLASTLQHPHIVQTYDVLQVRGEYFIIMELLEGCDLQELLKLLRDDELQLTVPQVLYLIERALAALHYAHERLGPDGVPLGITHRDVSPHNLFLTYEGGVKLLDFGIAKVQDMEKPTGTNMLKGKVLYMAPEQCQAGQVDRRTDIYSVGVVLYRLLGQAFPHRGSNAFDTMRAIIHDPPTSLRERAPDISAELDAVVMKSLEKHPDARFQTAREMQLEIVRISRGLGAFVSDLDFASLVRRMAPRDRPRKDAPKGSRLPEDLVVGGPAQSDTPDETTSSGRQELVSSDSAILERLHGVLLLQLRGSIDERLPVQALEPHLEGDLIVDTEHVVRVSSYGIRQLLALFDTRRGRRGATFHVRTSPVFIEQISMVRGLLGGGSVLSYQLPYVDPETGNPFTEMVDGERGARILSRREPPTVPCPGFSHRKAEFDDDPDTFFCFEAEYNARPPEHIGVVVKSLESGGQSKPVEKTVDAEATRLRVLRPLTTAMRWPRLVRGVEGHMVLDLEKVPYWEDDGLEQLSDALESVSKNLTMVEFRGVPVDVYRFLRKQQNLVGSRWVRSVRLATACTQCSTPRQVVVNADDLGALRKDPQVPSELCHRCAGRLEVVGDLPELTAVPAYERSLIPSSSLDGHLSNMASAPKPSAPSSHPTMPQPVAAQGIPLYIWAVLALTVLALFGSLFLLLVALSVLV